MSDQISIQIELPINNLKAYCDALPINKLAVFGSVLRADFTADSDVDILVEYETDAEISLLDMATQEIELSVLIGRQVDLRTPQELSPHFRLSVLEEATIIYERSR